MRGRYMRLLHEGARQAALARRDGIETILALKAKARAPKIIATSGGSRLVGRDVLNWGAHLGADQILSKPFRMSALIAMVGDVGEIDPAKAPLLAWSSERGQCAEASGAGCPCCPGG